MNGEMVKRMDLKRDALIVKSESQTIHERRFMNDFI